MKPYGIMQVMVFTWTRDGEWGKREEDATLRREERECGEEEKATRGGEGWEETAAAGERETLVEDEEQSEWDAAEKERAIIVTDGGETVEDTSDFWRCVGKLADELPLGCIWSHSLKS